MIELKECVHCYGKTITRGCYDCTLNGVEQCLNELQEGINDIKNKNNYTVHINKNYKETILQHINFNGMHNVSTVYLPDKVLACIVDMGRIKFEERKLDLWK